MNVEVRSPATLDEALAALGNATAETRILAGGTDLMVEFETGRTRPDRVIDIWKLAELRRIERDAGGLRLGALVNCSDLMRSQPVAGEIEILAAAAREVGAEQIRNRATLGGNLGTASPAADLNPVLLALSAVVRLRSRDARRDVEAHDFLSGYRQTLRRPDELIESVWIPPRPPSERRWFRKVGTRRAQSISKVVVALAVCVEGDAVASLRAAAGSVAERTILLPTLEADLVGHVPTPESLDAAARRAALDCQPIDDVRSTAAYRRHVLWHTLRRGLGACLLSA